MASLTLLDIIVILFVGGGAVMGVVRGFVYEVLSLFAWAAVVIALRLFYAPAAAALATHLSTRAGAGLLAFVVIGGVVYLGGRMVAARIGYRTRTSVLGPVDRLLGVGFGAVKGLIGATLLFMAGNLVFDLGFGGTAPRPEWVRNARAYPLLQASRRAIDEFVARRRAGSPELDNGSDAANSTGATAGPI
jgi:membrane protein required for colicin V production